MEPVSIILKVWNASRHVKLCLENLLGQTSSPFELIIVDNGSKPRLKEYLRRTAACVENIRLIENAANRGPGWANQQGAAVAAHRLLCLMDSDVLVPPGWLERLLAEMQQNPAARLLAPMQHEEAVIYPFDPPGRDSRQVWTDVKMRYAVQSPLEQFMLYSQGRSLADFERAICTANPFGLKKIASPPDFASSCCLLVDGEFVARVGGIADPDFHGYGSEDVDLCWRVGRLGGLIAKTSAVYVHHFQGASLDDNSLDRAAALRRANQVLYAKWKEPLLALALEKAQGGMEKLVAYLESHFIFSALARHTDFIDDLRHRTGIADIPDDLVWRSRGCG